MSSRVRTALLVVLALAVLAGPVVAPVLGATTATQTATTDDRVEPDHTTMVLRIQPDGDAHWTVMTTIVVETDDEREAFRVLANQFESGEAATLGLDAFRRASEAASRETGREMAIRNVERSHELRNETGRLILSFTWTNFGYQRGDRLVVDDAFNTSSGTWLPGLTENQTLVIEAPPDYGVTSAPMGPSIENGTIEWTGPRTFEPGYLAIEFTGAVETTTPPPRVIDADLYWAGGVALLAGVGLVLAYVLSRGHVGRTVTREASATGDGVATEDASPVTSAEDVSRSSEDDDGVDPSDRSATDEEADLELLSDEERVERLLEQNGGRMKQAAIVKETGWSNAKVSQLLSSMDDDGQIDKLRIGRENLISFPDEDLRDFEE